METVYRFIATKSRNRGTSVSGHEPTLQFDHRLPIAVLSALIQQCIRLRIVGASGPAIGQQGREGG
jgi:hypothetical protein